MAGRKLLDPILRLRTGMLPSDRGSIRVTPMTLPHGDSDLFQQAVAGPLHQHRRPTTYPWASAEL